MIVVACLLLAAAGGLSFEAIAACFRPPRRVLCEAAQEYRGRHWASGVEG